MPFRFEPDDRSLQSALRRIAAAELGTATTQLAQSGPVPAIGVHDIRKRIKKLRGLLRLLRPGFSDFAAENAALRDAGQHLSGMRDAEVRLATFERLFPDPPKPLVPLRHHLAALRDESTSAPGSTTEAAAILTALHARAADWRLTGKDRDILRQGLSQTRRRARATLATAEASPLIDPMHEWRKRAKDHWYQARLLAPIWPEVMVPIGTALSALTEDLGDHHDLGVLTDLAANLPKGIVKLAGLRQLTAATAAAQREIEGRVFTLGHRLFAGDPEEMACLWVNWWRLWRD